MKKLLVALLLLVLAAGLAAELLAPRLVEARIEERVAANTGGQVGVEADVESFPFLPGLATDGRISRLTLTLDELLGQQLPAARASFALEGIQLDRQSLLEGEVDVRDVDRGTFTVELTERTLSDALGLPVEITPDSIVARPAGASVEADLVVRGGNLVVSVAGGQGLRLPLPDDLPCEPAVEREEGLVRLTCAFEGLPGVLARAIAV